MARTETTTLPETPSRTWGRLGAVTFVLWCALLAGPAATGCKGFFDDQKEYWTDVRTRPDPWQVVLTTKSADRKAKFIPLLQEPLQNGGTQVQQDDMVNLLIAMSQNDPAPVCRLQAIHKLGEFKDPRRVEALQKAYYSASNLGEKDKDVASQVRQQALRALAETRDPVAQAELIRVARAAAKENTQVDEQMTLEERLTAVRGLANFRGREVNDAMLQILRTEKDIALRDRARRTLETITGRQLPDDAQAVEQALNASPDAAPQKSLNPLRLMGWQKQ